MQYSWHKKVFGWTLCEVAGCGWHYNQYSLFQKYLQVFWGCINTNKTGFQSFFGFGQPFNSQKYRFKASRLDRKKCSINMYGDWRIFIFRCLRHLFCALSENRLETWDIKLTLTNKTFRNKNKFIMLKAQHLRRENF